ncbi:MAG TPA: hypothetical protein VIT41_14835 [Microlunatus sp.]
MSSEPGQVLRYVVAGVAMAALAVIGVFYVSAGLVAPLWAVIGLMIIWVALVVVGILWFRRHPLRVLVLPVVAVAVWFAVITLGERLLGWTA